LTPEYTSGTLKLNWIPVYSAAFQLPFCLMRGVALRGSALYIGRFGGFCRLDAADSSGFRGVRIMRRLAAAWRSVPRSVPAKQGHIRDAAWHCRSTPRASL
jgi:hypothetical protein